MYIYDRNGLDAKHSEEIGAVPVPVLRNFIVLSLPILSMYDIH